MSEDRDKSWFRDGGPLGIENYKKAFVAYVIIATVLITAAFFRAF